jgi:hypothetical protein
MMKYFGIFLFALIMGYLLYPEINPPKETVIIRTQRERAITPIETRRHVVEDLPHAGGAIQGKEMNVQVDIQPEKVSEKKVIRSKMTPAEKIMANEIDQKTYLSFVHLPALTGQDSRILKLNGTFRGKLKNIKPSRTGILENITFAVNQDTEKEMTKFVVEDIYDNIQLNVYQLTESSFKSVPGDENLIMLRIPQGFIIFDLKSYPSISGKIFKMRKLSGQFVLTIKD